MRRFRSALAFLVAYVVALSASTVIQSQSGEQAVLVSCTVPCANVSALINSVGGRVTYEYENVAALAARIPPESVAQIAALVGGEAIRKDGLTALPTPRNVVTVDDPVTNSAQDFGTVDALQGLTQTLPTDYNFNNALINASSLHNAGYTGAGVIVAVIDSGTANSPVVASLAGTVIGGESLVPGATEPSATSRNNDAHGTWVGTVIAGHAIFGFSATSTLIRSLKIHAPEAIVGTCGTTGACAVPVIGVAPNARIYALKVFPAAGGSSPNSRVVAAMDRAITLRRNFNLGQPTTPVGGTGTEDDPFRYAALKIDVVNLSLGGLTLFAGQELSDKLTEAMLAVGITVAVSAGNDGPAAMTIGSPGTGLGALTVGAANTPKHERVLRDAQFGVGIGALYRPSEHIQTADFSSRGPNADGRLDPDVTANGFATFAQGTCTNAACRAGTAQASFSFISGTSFSSPTAAGAAALLRSLGGPVATATQVRNALANSANPTTLGDGSGRIDQGKGFLDAAAAFEAAPTARRSLPDANHRRHDDDDEVGGGGESVAENVRRAGFEIVRFRHDVFSTRINLLRPGQVAQLFVPSDALTDQITVALTNITPALPAAQQNQLFGDDIFLNVVDAPTSQATLLASAFVAADTSFVLNNPQTGLVRVALQGDWTNAGPISATVTLTRVRRPDGRSTLTRSIEQDEEVLIEVNVPAGTTQAVFETSWRQNWGRYPTNDLDMVLIDPLGGVNVAGATSASPERVTIATPISGTWTAVIVGFTIHDDRGDDDSGGEHGHGDDRHGHDRHDDDHHKEARDTFSFRALADGVRLKALK